MIRSFLALGVSSAWMVVGRASGLVWTVTLAATLGIGDVGRYAAAVALAAIIAAPLENVFVVRSLRVDDRSFERERTTRILLGLGLLVAGGALFVPVFGIGYALLVVAGEMLFNAVKSAHLRDGRPDRVMRMDAFRQLSSIGLAIGALALLGAGATLEVVVLAYYAPYLVVAVLAVRLALRARPAFPGGGRENLVLLWDAAVIALYLQGDILLLGLIASDEVVGAYSIASQLALAASIMGQLYGQSFTTRLREAGGDPAAGPGAKASAILGCIITLGAVVVGTVLVVATPYQHVGVAALALAAFAGMRAVDNVLTIVLYVQGRDVPRVAATTVALVVRLVVLLGVFAAGVDGAVATGIAASVAELLLLAAFVRLVRQPIRTEH